MKTGSLSRSERIAKYNELLRIEEELAGIAVFPGKDVFDSVRLRGGASRMTAPVARKAPRGDPSRQKKRRSK
jgi:hypothetical protein